MTVSNVSSNHISWQAYAQNNVQQRKQDLGNLASALQSGNLAGAQSAYADLQQSLGASPSSAQPASGSGNSPLSNDINAIGQALKSGNLSSARDAFAKFQQDAQLLRAGHHHHGPKTQASASPYALVAAAGNGTGTNAVNVSV